MNITVNGTDHDYPENTTLAGLIGEVTGHDPDSDQLGVAVALDSGVVPRSRWATTTLTGGTQVEIITAMQGG
ncbi:MAG: sulfur carrier protein ThiS [Corynebacterium sp.]|uniref:sulfur carrier protein ThiS n=1 Tax=Corynebacterium sp. TaxID=1720 RepID=UPI003F99BD7E